MPSQKGQALLTLQFRKTVTLRQRLQAASSKRLTSMLCDWSRKDQLHAPQRRARPYPSHTLLPLESIRQLLEGNWQKTGTDISNNSIVTAVIPIEILYTPARGYFSMDLQIASKERIWQQSPSFGVIAMIDVSSDHLGAREQIWQSQFSLQRKSSQGTLSSTLLPPLRNFTTRFSRSKSNLVHNSLTLPGGTERPASSLPALYNARPSLPTTPIFSSQPPKKELLRTFPASLASRRTYQLTPSLTRLIGCGLLPMICSFRVMRRAKTKQYWSRKCTSLMRLPLTARNTSSASARVSLIRRLPEGVGEAISFTLMMSYRGMVRSASQMAVSLNYSHRYSHTFTPFFEGTYTSNRQRTYLRCECLSFKRTDESSPLLSLSPRLSLSSRTDLMAVCTSNDAKPNGEDSSLKGTRCTLIWGGFNARGRIVISSFSSELLLPNSFRLTMAASWRRAMRSCVYFFRSCLKSSCAGELEESVLQSFCSLRSRGTGARTGRSSELELLARSRLSNACAYSLRALRSARQTCRSRLNYPED